MYDVIIIGAGISGALIAHRLSKYQLKVLVLEKENDVANGASGANSAIIHSGHDPKEGTNKCKYNLEGARLYPALCEELKVAYKQIGALVVATNNEEEEALKMIMNKCRAREIPYELLNRTTAIKIENNLSDGVSTALALPSTAIITPWEVVMAAIEEAMLNGVELRLNYEVKKLSKKNDYFEINDDLKTKVLINASGVHVDDITNMLRKSPYKVEAKKGEYYILDHDKNPLVSKVIYPTPTKKGKGVLAVLTVHNNVLLGPNSDYLDDKDDVSTDAGLDYVKDNISKIVKNIPYKKMIHTFAGIRPHIDLNDFYIQEDDEIENFIHVAGIESPGLTGAPAIAKEVVDNIVLKKFDSLKKDNYLRRKAYIKMQELSIEEQNELIQKDPSFGKLVCRCEKISEGEIKDIINRKCGATTIKGVRLRARPTMGRCQGGFCEVEILKILARELNKDIKDIYTNKVGSNIVISSAKEDL